MKETTHTVRSHLIVPVAVMALLTTSVLLHAVNTSQPTCVVPNRLQPGSTESVSLAGIDITSDDIVSARGDELYINFYDSGGNQVYYFTIDTKNPDSIQLRTGATDQSIKSACGFAESIDEYDAIDLTITSAATTPEGVYDIAVGASAYKGGAKINVSMTAPEPISSDGPGDDPIATPGTDGATNAGTGNTTGTGGNGTAPITGGKPDSPTSSVTPPECAGQQACIGVEDEGCGFSLTPQKQTTISPLLLFAFSLLFVKIFRRLITTRPNKDSKK